MSHNYSSELKFVSLSGTTKLLGDGTNVGKIKINCELNSHGITIQSPAHSANADYVLTLPVNDGDPNQVLQTDGSGVLSWVAQSGGGGASRPPVDEITATGTISAPLSTDMQAFYYVDQSTAVTITLPTASSAAEGFLLNIKRLGSGTVDVQRQSTDYIDVSTQTSISLSQYDSLTFLADATNNRWLLV